MPNCYRITRPLELYSLVRPCVLSREIAVVHNATPHFGYTTRCDCANGVVLVMMKHVTSVMANNIQPQLLDSYDI